MYSHDYDAAIDTFKKTVEMEPTYGFTCWYLGFAYEQRNRHAESLTELRKAKDLPQQNVSIQADIGHYYAVSGKTAEARKVINDLKEISKRRVRPARATSGLLNVYTILSPSW